MKVTATLKNLRISPRKVRLVVDSVRGMNTNAALIQLSQIIKRSAPEVEKLLKSAVANAENNFGLDKDNLFIEEIIVGEGTRLKRWLPRAHGRATLILKRASHIKIALAEIVEGKNRKSKEQMEKEKKKREEEKEKLMKEFEKMQEKEEKEITEKEKDGAPKVLNKAKKEESKKGADSGFLKKVFNRKSV
jgi:large subunit ribosomal protein L22